MTMYATQYNILRFFHKNIEYKSVVEFIYHNNFFFKCAYKKIHLTEVNRVSNLATYSSPTDGAQITSNDSIISTSAFL